MRLQQLQPWWPAHGALCCAPHPLTGRRVATSAPGHLGRWTLCPLSCRPAQTAGQLNGVRSGPVLPGGHKARRAAKRTFVLLQAGTCAAQAGGRVSRRSRAATPLRTAACDLTAVIPAGPNQAGTVKQEQPGIGRHTACWPHLEVAVWEVGHCQGVHPVGLRQRLQAAVDDHLHTGRASKAQADSRRAPGHQLQPEQHEGEARQRTPARERARQPGTGMHEVHARTQGMSRPGGQDQGHQPAAGVPRRRLRGPVGTCR